MEWSVVFWIIVVIIAQLVWAVLFVRMVRRKINRWRGTNAS
jgi:hypothetical protein